MSIESVEIVRRLYEAWQRDGYGVVPELMDPDIEFVNPAYAVEPGTRHGYDGFAAAARSLASVYSDYRVVAAQFYDAGDRVAVRATVTTRSVARSVPIEAERGYVFDIRAGKVIRFAWFSDPTEALEAVELTE
jgi:ketosteroid isomerase-like protein